MKRLTYVTALLLGVPFAPAILQAQDSTELKAMIEQSAETVLERCAQDLERFCDDATPGEGRMLSCLLAYDDQVSDACAEALSDWERPTFEQAYQSTQLYPTLEDRELGEPHLDEDGERVIWNRRLPFLAQQVVDLGFDLPNPYGVALIPARIRQELVLENLFIGIGGEPDREIEFVDFGRPEVENNTLQLKLDVWLLPFMNVFATVGVVDGDATIPLTIQGTDLFPTLCSITPTAPQCVRTYSATARPSYEGNNISLGMNLAMGWDRFFVTLPMIYAWTDVDIIDTTVEALHISPRIGMTGDMGDRGTVAVFLGATYLEAEVDVAGSVTFDTPGGPDGDTTTLSFIITQRNKDRWNYLLGFNWDLSKKWSVMAEGGFGGTRENFIAGITYRF